MFVLGVGIGASMQVLVIAVQNAVDYKDLGAGTSGTTFFRSIGGSFGTAIFGAIFANVLTGNLTHALAGKSLPPGITASSGATPATLDKLPAAIHEAYISGYAASLRTVFLVAVPVGIVAFLLSWTLKELPLRTTTRAVDPADRLAPTARPTIRTSEEEMERALSTLNIRERRLEVYSDIVQRAGVALSPRAGWLLIRLGEHPGDNELRLAERLHISVPNLTERLGELGRAGMVDVLGRPEDPIELTRAGVTAHAALFAARQERIQRFLDGWDSAAHPELLRLLSRFTHELAAGDEEPGKDLETSGARATSGT